MAVVPFVKNYTETLTEMLERFRLTHPQYAESSCTYAGRLDPLAQGLVLILTDEDRFEKETYLLLDKVYEVECLLGVDTDTYDLLGIPQEQYLTASQDELLEKVESLKKMVKYPYPPYSSKPVDGVPLWKHTRQRTLHTITTPLQNIEVKEAKVVTINTRPSAEILTSIQQGVGRVKGDFRQEDILTAWGKVLTHEQYQTCTIRFSVSSGTYIRSLVHELGKRLGGGACCIWIKRISVGKYTL